MASIFLTVIIPAPGLSASVFCSATALVQDAAEISLLAEEVLALSWREASSMFLAGGKYCPWCINLAPSDLSGDKPRCVPVSAS